MNRNLTVTLGLRMEYERGATERYDRALAYFDPNLELPISAAAEAAYARNPIPELPASAFDVRGGPVYAGQNGAPRELWQSELMWLPRVSAAWQLGSKAIVRGGYGVYYDTLNVMNSAVDQFGFSRATSTQLTNDAGTTWLAGDPRNGISPLVDPFPLRADGSRFDVPVRDALGSMARVGEGLTFGRFDRQHPRVQRWRAGIQRELGANMLVEASYWGQYADRLFVTTRLDALPEQYWNATNTRNNAIATNLNQQVPNPFYIANFESLRTSDPALYRQLSTLSQFTSPTIAKNRLLRPFPHMNGLERHRAEHRRGPDARLRVQLPAPVRAGLHGERVLHPDVPEEPDVPRQRVRERADASGTPATRPGRTASRRPVSTSCRSAGGGASCRRGRSITSWAAGRWP